MTELSNFYHEYLGVSMECMRMDSYSTVTDFARFLG